MPVRYIGERSCSHCRRHQPDVAAVSGPTCHVLLKQYLQPAAAAADGGGCWTSSEGGREGAVWGSRKESRKLFSRIPRSLIGSVAGRGTARRKQSSSCKSLDKRIQGMRKIDRESARSRCRTRFFFFFFRFFFCCLLFVFLFLALFIARDCFS